MNKWNVSISEAQVEGSIQSGSFDCNKSQIPSFRFVEADKKSIPLGPYKYLMIDTAKWYQYWESDLITYLPQNLYDLPEFRQNEIFEILQRSRLLHESICISYEVNSPSFEKTTKGAQLSIEDGRHRIHLIKSLGIPAFPAAVPVDIVEELDQRGLLYHA